MILTCSRQALSDAANHVARVVPAKSTYPALTGILLTAKGGSVTLSGYDLEMGMTTVLDANVEEPGHIVLDAKLFCDIVRRLPDESVTLNVNERNLCQITSGKSLFSLIGINGDEYPELPTIQDGTSVSLEAGLLESMVRQTIYATGDPNGSRPVLSGIKFEVADGEMKLIAVDGSRLAVRCEKIATEQEMSFIVPAKAMSEVIKLMGEAETVSLSVSNRQIVFAVNGYDVVSRLLEGEFINYKRTIPPTTSTKVIANTADMIDTVERISQVIVERLRTPVTCRFEDGVFHATCTTELGNAQDEMPVKMEGESMTIGCNSRFLIDALRAAETDEIEISMSGPVSPIVIRPTQGDAFLFIVLPVRIK